MRGPPLAAGCLVLLALNACAEKSETGVLTPTTFVLNGYVGLTTHREIELLFNGQPVATTDVQVQQSEDAGVEFSLTRLPLSPLLRLDFSPDDEADFSAHFTLTYRGRNYDLRVSGHAEQPILCQAPRDECYANRFNPDTGACEITSLTGSPCEMEDCTRPGTCSAGVCLHQDLQSIRPRCSEDLPVETLAPTWAWPLYGTDDVVGPITFDDEGNVYFFECPGGCILDSLNPRGQLRWQSWRITGVGGDILTAQIQATSELIVTLARATGVDFLRAIRRGDGTTQWETLIETFTGAMLVMNDEIWVYSINDQYKGEVRIFDLSDGRLRRILTLPDSVEGTQFLFRNIIHGADGRVYATGFKQYGPPEDQDATGIAAIDAATGELLWTMMEVHHPLDTWEAGPLAGSTLVLVNGRAVDVQTKELHTNERLHAALSIQENGGFTHAFALQPDGAGFVDWNSNGRRGCEDRILGHYDYRQDRVDWECAFSSEKVDTETLALTPAGSVAMVTLRRESGVAGGRLRPRLRIFGVDGGERLNGHLAFEPSDIVGHRLVGVHASRLVLQQGAREGQRYLVAYDVPALVTK